MSILPSDQRFTPQDVLDVVRMFAPIETDPSTTAANPLGAQVFFDGKKLGCGLERPWSGFTFSNPPYSRGQLGAWGHKAWSEWTLGQVESILLVPADTSTQATQFLLEHANAVAFWAKRIRFTGDAGAKFANALFYFGERQGRFKRVFEAHATVLVLR